MKLFPPQTDGASPSRSTPRDEGHGCLASCVAAGGHFDWLFHDAEIVAKFRGDGAVPAASFFLQEGLKTRNNKNASMETLAFGKTALKTKVEKLSEASLQVSVHLHCLCVGLYTQHQTLAVFARLYSLRGKVRRSPRGVRAKVRLAEVLVEQLGEVQGSRSLVLCKRVVHLGVRTPPPATAADKRWRAESAKEQQELLLTAPTRLPSFQAKAPTAPTAPSPAKTTHCSAALREAVASGREFRSAAIHAAEAAEGDGEADVPGEAQTQAPQSAASAPDLRDTELHEDFSTGKDRLRRRCKSPPSASTEIDVPRRTPVVNNALSLEPRFERTGDEDFSSKTPELGGGISARGRRTRGGFFREGVEMHSKVWGAKTAFASPKEGLESSVGGEESCGGSFGRTDAPQDLLVFWEQAETSEEGRDNTGEKTWSAVQSQVALDVKLRPNKQLAEVVAEVRSLHAFPTTQLLKTVTDAYLHLKRCLHEERLRASCLLKLLLANPAAPRAAAALGIEIGLGLAAPGADCPSAFPFLLSAADAARTPRPSAVKFCFGEPGSPSTRGGRRLREHPPLGTPPVERPTKTKFLRTRKSVHAAADPPRPRARARNSLLKETLHEKPCVAPRRPIGSLLPPALAGLPRLDSSSGSGVEFSEKDRPPSMTPKDPKEATTGTAAAPPEPPGDAASPAAPKRKGKDFRKTNNNPTNSNAAALSRTSVHLVLHDVSCSFLTPVSVSASPLLGPQDKAASKKRGRWEGSVEEAGPACSAGEVLDSGVSVLRSRESAAACGGSDVVEERPSEEPGLQGFAPAAACASAEWTTAPLIFSPDACLPWRGECGSLEAELLSRAAVVDAASIGVRVNADMRLVHSRGRACEEDRFSAGRGSSGVEETLRLDVWRVECSLLRNATWTVASLVLFDLRFLAECRRVQRVLLETTETRASSPAAAFPAELAGLQSSSPPQANREGETRRGVLASPDRGAFAASDATRRALAVGDSAKGGRRDKTTTTTSTTLHNGEGARGRAAKASFGDLLSSGSSPVFRWMSRRTTGNFSPPPSAESKIGGLSKKLATAPTRRSTLYTTRLASPAVAEHQGNSKAFQRGRSLLWERTARRSLGGASASIAGGDSRIRRESEESFTGNAAAAANAASATGTWRSFSFLRSNRSFSVPHPPNADPHYFDHNARDGRLSLHALSLDPGSDRGDAERSKAHKAVFGESMNLQR